MINPVTFLSQEEMENISSVEQQNPVMFLKNITKPPLVDDWIAEEGDKIFTSCKGAFIAPISTYYGIDKDDEAAEIDYFMLSSKKRCYTSPKMQEHLCQYLNYFERYYDKEKELLMIYCHLKPLIDYEPLYDKEQFLYDIRKYILSSSILFKVKQMDDDNYHINLTYKNNNSSICYSNKHAKILMKISLLINMIIPLIGHFMYVRNIASDNNTILEVYDYLLDIFDHVDIYSKLYETTITNVNNSYKRNVGLWEQQDIRSKNITTHSLYCIENILLNVLPKYVYNENIINYNFSSIDCNNEYQVTGISWEYSFIPLSSSNRDDDNNSEFDKFESLLARQDEALLIHNKVNCEQTMKQIEYMFGPFEDEEIAFYLNELGGEKHPFQQYLIFNIFYKFFGVPISIKAINIIDYIKLMISAKRLLESYQLRLMPDIISSKIVKFVKKKSINKKELTKFINSTQYELIKDKYRDENIRNSIFSIIATIIASSFKVIDYNDKDYNGTILDCISNIITEEVGILINLI